MISDTICWVVSRLLTHSPSRSMGDAIFELVRLYAESEMTCYTGAVPLGVLCLVLDIVGEVQAGICFHLKHR